MLASIITEPTSLVLVDQGIYQVVLLSPEDGRLRLTEVATEVCKGVVGRKEQLEQINVDTLKPRITGQIHTRSRKTFLVSNSHFPVFMHGQVNFVLFQQFSAQKEKDNLACYCGLLCS